MLRAGCSETSNNYGRYNHDHCEGEANHTLSRDIFNSKTWSLLIYEFNPSSRNILQSATPDSGPSSTSALGSGYFNSSRAL
jgi:hypothetical protein